MKAISRLSLVGAVVITASIVTAITGDAADQTQPIVEQDRVAIESDGRIAIEAEHFYQQTLSDRRAWYITNADHIPEVTPDGDPQHIDGASGDAYVELLPDTRRSHGDKLVTGDNFINRGGRMAVLHYKFRAANPGRFYIWARAFSTTTEDNGLHFGLDGQWPESGARWQTIKKNGWNWDCKQRTEKVHVGVPMQLWLDIDKAGDHDLLMSMREDGTEVDHIVLARDAGWRPDGVQYAREPKENPIQPTAATERPLGPPLVLPRQPDGDGRVEISGELKQWHKVTLTLDGPYAHELDNAPNPFVNYQFDVALTHQSGSPRYVVPGYFAADGNAAETSAQSGTKWRAHLSPDKSGRWDYTIQLRKGTLIVETDYPVFEDIDLRQSKSGSFVVAATDKAGRDLRAHGRLQYASERYLKFAGSGEYFLKAGADAPETLLGYADFDGTIAGKPKKVPLKTWAPHVRDWRQGDPSWKNGKGTGLIGAINYLSEKGCNAFSFLTYNAGGDGDNVWPFVERDDKLHYDCSKLDQWSIVFDHGTARGMYLHFKMQENETDDNRRGAERRGNVVPESLDGGELGTQRRLYCRELIARFGHNLALNWNLGEENTQSTEEQQAMIDFIARVDPYDHNIVIHTFPDQQDKVYQPLLGDASKLTGLSLQNSGIHDTHWQVVKWVRQSQAAGKPWVVAFDESGTAAHGQCPDVGYKGFDGRDRSGRMIYTEHEVRRQTLWGALMGGGAGVEYYFGYQFVENDLVCEDWRSRDRSWDYCRVAINFFRDHRIPFHRMRPADELVGTDGRDNSRYCLAKPGELYLVYIASADPATLDMSATTGRYNVQWFNPRTGGDLVAGDVVEVIGGGKVQLTPPTKDAKDDWLAVVRKRYNSGSSRPRKEDTTW